MKRKWMLFVSFVALFMTALPASAGLTENLIIGGEFTSGSFTGVNSAIPLSSDTWYTSMTPSITTLPNDWRISSNSAMVNTPTSGSPPRAGSLIQTVNYPTASYGPVQLSFNYELNTAHSYATAALYGSNTQPIYGSYGTQIGSIVLSTRAPTPVPFTETFDGLSFLGYDWYTVIFYGDASYDSRVYVDGVSLKVSEGTVNPVPLPGAAWLLGPGLIGLAALRRRYRK
jgi:hypothetical protein